MKYDGKYTWVKHATNAAVVMSGEIITTNSNTVVFIATVEAATVAYVWSSSATADGAYAIVPYFKLAPVVASETDLTKFEDFDITLESVAGGSGTLDLKATTGGAVMSAAQTWSNVDKTLTRHHRGFDNESGTGRRLESFEFNANVTPATFTGLQVNHLEFTYSLKSRRGDATKTS